MPHQHFQACIDECAACRVACLHCATACLTEKDVLTLSTCIRLDLDCAEICEAAVGVMARGSAQATACARKSVKPAPPSVPSTPTSTVSSARVPARHAPTPVVPCIEGGIPDQSR